MSKVSISVCPLFRKLFLVCPDLLQATGDREVKSTPGTYT